MLNRSVNTNNLINEEDNHASRERQRSRYREILYGILLLGIAAASGYGTYLAAINEHDRQENLTPEEKKINCNYDNPDCKGDYGATIFLAFTSIGSAIGAFSLFTGCTNDEPSRPTLSVENNNNNAVEMPPIGSLQSAGVSTLFNNQRMLREPLIQAEPISSTDIVLRI